MWDFIRSPENSNGIIAFLTFMIFLATAGYLFISALQWRAIEASNKINKEALVSVQAAFVYVDRFNLVLLSDEAGKQIVGARVTAMLKNSGTTPGINGRFWINRSFDELDPKFPDRDENGKEIADSESRTRSFNSFYAPQGLTESPSFDIPTADILAKRPVWTYGWIRYRDVFSGTKEHITMFCYRITFEAFPTEAGAHTQPLMRWTAEQAHDCADGQCGEHK